MREQPLLFVSFERLLDFSRFTSHLRLTLVTGSILRPLSQTDISKCDFKDGHISRLCFVFRVIQVIIRKVFLCGGSWPLIQIRSEGAPPDFKAFFFEKRPCKHFSTNVPIRGEMNPLHKHKGMSVGYQVKQNLKISFMKTHLEKWSWESGGLKIGPTTGFPYVQWCKPARQRERDNDVYWKTNRKIKNNLQPVNFKGVKHGLTSTWFVPLSLVCASQFFAFARVWPLPRSLLPSQWRRSIVFRVLLQQTNKQTNSPDPTNHDKKFQGRPRRNAFVYWYTANANHFHQTSEECSKSKTQLVEL